MDILVLYYSLTGNTRKMAEALARELGADLREIECPAYRRWYGPLAMFWDILTGHRPQVLPLGSPGSYYDLIIVGGPVWAAQAAPPVLRALEECGRHFRRTALFVTCRGTNRAWRPVDAITEMSIPLAARPVGTRIFRAAEIAPDAFETSVAEFSAALRAPAAGGATRAQGGSVGRNPLDWRSNLASRRA
jgi:hypothetical protein